DRGDADEGVNHRRKLHAFAVRADRARGDGGHRAARYRPGPVCAYRAGRGTDSHDGRCAMTAPRTWILAGAIGLAVLAPTAASAQCAMCRRALLSPEGQQLVAAFRSGILFL